MVTLLLIKRDVCIDWYSDSRERTNVDVSICAQLLVAKISSTLPMNDLSRDVDGARDRLLFMHAYAGVARLA